MPEPRMFKLGPFWFQRRSWFITKIAPLSLIPFFYNTGKKGIILPFLRIMWLPHTLPVLSLVIRRNRRSP